MNRSILAIATALLAAPALFASTAEACISCEYVPEVVRSSSTLPHTGHYYSAAPYEHKAVERSIAVERSAPTKKRIVKSEPVAKSVDTAEAAPTKTEAKNENSSISSVAEVAAVEPAKVEPKTVKSENSSISLASTEFVATEKAPATKTTKEAAAKPVDCKNFFPSVGMTLTVRCE